MPTDNSFQKILGKYKNPRILVYGIGNPSRQDDALGILFIERLTKWAADKRILNLSFDSNYQLNIEDALDISEKDVVIFVDASMESIEDFKFQQLSAPESISFSTHAMHPSSVLSLCEELYDKRPSAFLLTIKGYSWDIGSPPSESARKNLK